MSGQRYSELVPSYHDYSYGARRATVVPLPASRGSQDGSAMSNARFHKTRMCLFHQRGACIKGSRCSYAHSNSELKPTPDLVKTRLCQDWLAGDCKSPDCKFAHGRHELRFTHDFYKTKICLFWQQGGCTKGALCRHAHGQHEIRSAELVGGETESASVMEAAEHPQLEQKGAWPRNAIPGATGVYGDRRLLQSDKQMDMSTYYSLSGQRYSKDLLVPNAGSDSLFQNSFLPCVQNSSAPDSFDQGALRERLPGELSLIRGSVEGKSLNQDLLGEESMAQRWWAERWITRREPTSGKEPWPSQPVLTELGRMSRDHELGDSDLMPWGSPFPPDHRDRARRSPRASPPDEVHILPVTPWTSKLERSSPKLGSSPSAGLLSGSTTRGSTVRGSTRRGSLFSGSPSGGIRDGSHREGALKSVDGRPGDGSVANTGEADGAKGATFLSSSSTANDLWSLTDLLSAGHEDLGGLELRPTPDPSDSHRHQESLLVTRASGGPSAMSVAPTAHIKKPCAGLEAQKQDEISKHQDGQCAVASLDIPRKRSRRRSRNRRVSEKDARSNARDCLQLGIAERQRNSCHTEFDALHDDRADYYGNSSLQDDRAGYYGNSTNQKWTNQSPASGATTPTSHTRTPTSNPRSPSGTTGRSIDPSRSFISSEKVYDPEWQRVDMCEALDASRTIQSQQRNRDCLAGASSAKEEGSPIPEFSGGHHGISASLKEFLLATENRGSGDGGCELQEFTATLTRLLLGEAGLADAELQGAAPWNIQ